MPVKMLNFLKQGRPPCRRHYNGIIRKTKEYQDIVVALGAGLKPQEYITADFPPEHEIHNKMKHPLGTLRAAVVKQVKELELPYDVYEVNHVLYIVGRGVIS